MFHLTQYVVVRRDLPFDSIMPQATHAAGKAMFCYAAKLANEGHVEATWPELKADWGHPTRIIRGARNEAKLKKLVDKLRQAQIPYVTIIEPDDGPLKGQMTALALFPGDKEELGHVLNEFQNLRWKDVPAAIQWAKENAGEAQGKSSEEISRVVGSSPAPGSESEK